MKRFVVGAMMIAIAVGGFIAIAGAQDDSPGAQTRPAAPRAQPPDMGGILIQGLRDTPGCLGVDAGDMMSGKNTIIAWFENKAAAVRWYHSDVHQGIIGQVVGADAGFGTEPLAHVADEKTPVMVIASITFADRPHLEGLKLPISQIAIELYAPLPGGAHVGGRLAPATLKVPHMRDYTPQ